MRRFVLSSAIALGSALFSAPALAQEEAGAAAPEATATDGSVDAASAAPEQPALPWQAGPLTAPIGDALAEIDLPEGYVFLDKDGTAELLRMTGNLVGESDLATFAKSDGSGWFVVFEWDSSGWVDDSDRDELDADALLSSLKEGNEAAAEQRKQLGLAQLELVGWHEAPHYDPNTNNLTWAIKLRSEDGESVNRLVKLLGRRGVMSATLVAAPEELGAAQAEVDRVLEGYRFRPGSTYAEYLPGTDTAAGYGLAGLVAGGVLAKTGLLAKFWKVIAGGAVAAVAAIRRLFGGKPSGAPTA